MRTKSFSQSGFTLVELIAILVVIAILRAIAIPKLAQARAAKQRRSCQANLHLFGTGAGPGTLKGSWAVESKHGLGAVPADSDLFGPTLYLRAKPLCPLGGTYSLNDIGAKPTCSKSAAPDFHTY